MKGDNRNVYATPSDYDKSGFRNAIPTLLPVHSNPGTSEYGRLPASKPNQS